MRSIKISISKQELYLIEDDGIIQTLPISTATNGTGQQQNSECTPLGLHSIAAKIGADEPINTVFVGRKPTGEIYTPELGEQHPGRDWILTRILWLQGVEPGFNQGGEVDSKERYIYIHGTYDAKPMGIPSSRGCINLHTPEMLQLFDFADINMPVLIEA